MSAKQILLWYRNDLRLHDHQPLAQALSQGATIVPLYCFDDRHFGQTSFGFPKTGKFRAKFLLESVADLRSAWQARGSDLLVRRGLPEQVIAQLVDRLQITDIYYHREVTAEELAVEAAVAKQVKNANVNLRSFWGHTLYHPEDLPFSIANLPELFTAFRKQVEAESTIAPPLTAPATLPPLPIPIDRGDIPSLEDLGLEIPQLVRESSPLGNPRGVLAYHGGETAGLARLDEYIWQCDRLRIYKETRNEMLGANYSSKFSAWLSLGCLSPRYVRQQLKQYETERVKNDSTYWLIFELLWRDYFRFICAKHGNNIFKRSGLQGIDIGGSQDRELFNLWCDGKTGFPLVDANMHELAATGYMSNRGRQNVASFLTKNLGIDWRMGAEWFESLLIDHDVCSNWGNWNYTAGVGNDARGFRFFNIIKQSHDYDPEGKYVKYWLPQLALVPAAKIHEPWKLLPIEQERYGVKIGVDYPRAIVDLFASARQNEITYNRVHNSNGNYRNSGDRRPRKSKQFK